MVNWDLIIFVLIVMAFMLGLGLIEKLFKAASKRDCRNLGYGEDNGNDK